MSNLGRCKSAKHDSLFMIYIASHETNIYIAKIMRNHIVVNNMYMYNILKNKFRNILRNSIISGCRTP